VRDQQAKFTGIEENLTGVGNELRTLRHRVGDPDANLSREAISAGLVNDPLPQRPKLPQLPADST
jgi:hypothetical protein